MSSRAYLYVGSGAKAKEVAESKTWIPLCWLTLPSAEDVARGVDAGCVTANRKAAIDRAGGAVPFLAELFPEFQTLPGCADALMAALRKCRATTIAIELGDHVAMAPETFPVALAAAVQAIESRDARRSLAVPARRVPNPFGAVPITTKAATLRTTRDVLCHAAGMYPTTDGDNAERDQLVGYLS